jgi:hypothetical protein
MNQKVQPAAAFLYGEEGRKAARFLFWITDYNRLQGEVTSF